MEFNEYIAHERLTRELFLDALGLMLVISSLAVVAIGIAGEVCGL